MRHQTAAMPLAWPHHRTLPRVPRSHAALPSARASCRTAARLPDELTVRGCGPNDRVVGTAAIAARTAAVTSFGRGSAPPEKGSGSCGGLCEGENRVRA
jgi:hypothetical protein